MVEIVSIQPHPSVSKECICRNCGATLRYVPVDIKEKKEYDYTGDCDLVNYIVCPNCATDVTVKRF
jgi:hypothetical protein